MAFLLLCQVGTWAIQCLLVPELSVSSSIGIDGAGLLAVQQPTPYGSDQVLDGGHNVEGEVA